LTKALQHNRFGIEDFDRLSRTLSTEGYDFGRMPKPPTQQALDSLADALKRGSA
jgi:hypothetical protein